MRGASQGWSDLGLEDTRAIGGRKHRSLEVIPQPSELSIRMRCKSDPFSCGNFNSVQMNVGCPLCFGFPCGCALVQRITLI